MSDIATALNRFGLGARVGDAVPNDARSWLLDQFSRYNPTPAPLAGLPKGSDAAFGLVQFRRERGRKQRQAREQQSEELTQEFRELFGKHRQAGREEYTEAVGARGQVAVISAAPFVERLVHFWSNHFAISVSKPLAFQFAGPAEFDAIRPNVLRSFRSLLRAAALHPAMLLYLDQIQSVGPNSEASAVINPRRTATGRGEVGLNENLAREILELHTVGVGAGYSQSDVTEFARALTGFTFAGLPGTRRARDIGNGTAFDAGLHEPGSRTVMGKTYAQQGRDQGLAILDDLAIHPATARHVATKLARHFASDDPPASLVSRLTKAFLDSDGDLPTVYRALIEAPEPWAEGRTKFRSPWDWSIASLRAVGIDAIDPRRFMLMQRELGQPVWAPSSPQGFPDTASEWAAADALIRRIDVSERLARGARPDDVAALARSLFPDALNEATQAAIRRAESPRQALALLLASPEMMRR